ncbi:SusC/RagA family TonB-linked outer membrane protein [Mucilaginibacter sp.]|uniref:SusC/RagA family TonB-linked outer membrane protein n=1 Tax=Mucilaginibacter sp. TaxID=1882438 RepID=UPI003D0FA7F3
MALFLTVVQAQTRKITGKVISDHDKLPLPGVTIVVKGTANGTQTSNSGEYSITATKGDVLIFTFIGAISQQIAVGDQSSIDVSLKDDATKLQEVLVVGYGTQSRSTVTSAVAKLDNQVLANAPRANVATALQGTVSGVQVVAASGSPGSQPLVLLRGGASINSPGSPLTVVDGVIRPYNDIPQEDIESVSILKDAAATAIYGARANNGVILITTKKGKSGSSNVTYKFTTGFNRERQGYKYVDAADYIYYGRLGRLNNFLALNPGETTLTTGQLTTLNNSRGYGLLTDPADLGSFDIQAETPANIGLLKQGWQDENDPANPGHKIIFKDHSGQVANALFQNTQTVDHYVAASGGNDKGTYFSSFDYYNEPGVIVGSTYNRYSGNVNGSYKVKPNVEISSGINFSTVNQLGVASNSESNDIYRTLSLWPTFNPWLNAAQTVPNPGNSITDGNPLYWLQKTKRSNEIDRVTGNAAINWKILPGLSLKLSGSGYFYENINQSFTDATQLYTNIFANPQTYNNTARPATAYTERDFQQTYDAILNYNKSFGKNNFNLLLGGEYFNTSIFQEQVSGTGAPTDNISTANASTIFAAGSNYSQSSATRIISSFTRLNYDYDQKYLLTFVLREDGVSVLSYQKRIGFFPGMSAGWNLQKEDFFQNSGVSKIISTIKPRISYGSNGNVTSIGAYDVQGIYSSTNTYNGIGGISNTAPTLNTLQWETSSTKDVGIDLGFFNDRISLLFDYYDRVTSNLITKLQLPSYAGFSTLETNDGSLQNKGVEFTLKANIINNPGGLRLDFGATASYDKNKILKLPNNGQPNNRQNTIQVFDPKTGQLISVGGLQQGQAMGQIYGYKELGIFANEAQVQSVAGNRKDNIANITGPNLAAGSGGHIQPGDVNWQDVNGDGIIDSRDQVYLGNIYPTWTGGFNFNAAYKNFSFYTRFDYSLGSTIYNDFVARSLGGYQGTFNFINEIKNAWTPTNTNTMIPKVYYADQVAGSKDNYTRGNNGGSSLQGENSQFYESGNYLACREVTLSYDFPKALLTRTKVFSSARLFVSGENLFYIKKFSGPDPEAPVSGNTITGVYTGTYPTPRTYVLGVQVSL